LPGTIRDRSGLPRIKSVFRFKIRATILNGPVSTMHRLGYLRRRLYAPAPVIIWFVLIFGALAFLGWPFNFIGFLSLFVFYLWVLWAQ